MNYFLKIALFVPLLLLAGFVKAQHSVLARGKWLKIGVTETGIYGIDENFLKKLQLNTAGINPAHLRVFGNKAGVLPQPNAAPRIPDLVELSVLCTDTDGRFDRNDRIYFLGYSPHQVSLNEAGTRFTHQINPYSDTTFYYLTYTEGPSKKIMPAASVAGPLTVIREFDHYEFYEVDQKNLLSSGREWLGEFITSRASFSLKIEGLVLSRPLTIHSSVLSTGRNDQLMDLSVDTKTIGTHQLQRTLYSPTDVYARYNRIGNWDEKDLPASPAGESFALGYALQGTNNAGAYLNYFSVNARRQLRQYPGQTVARIIQPDKNSKTYTFSISETNQQSLIWEAEDPFEPKLVNNPISGTVQFTGSFKSPFKLLMITNPEQAYTPSFSGFVANQDIRSSAVPDLLIVFPESFRAEALRLAAFRKSNDGLEVQALSTEEIYHEFSAGSPDPTAIRDLCRFYRQKNSDKFKYLLLFGDGSYDYKNISSFSFVNTRLSIPTYESRESMEPVYSYASDDYFGFLEDHEGEWKEGYSEDNFWYKSREDDHTLDIGIGRLPVKSREEARAVVDKLIYYATLGKSQGKWKNRISFVADDKDYNIHQRDAEGLSASLSSANPGFHIRKLYLDAYPQVSSPNGPRSPKASEAMKKAVEDGSFVINYNGHGSEDGWTEEKLLTTADITQWRNLRNLPLFFTATCQFGKFDNPSLVSGAELALLNPSGGAIGLLTTTRPVYSSTNYKINTAFYDFLTAEGVRRVGDLFRLTKNAAIDGEINRNFAFLGDPSLLLPDFKSNIKITRINGKAPEGQVLKALSKVTVEGEVNVPGFNGTLNFALYDKPSKVSTLGSSPESPKMEFELLRSRLFEGVVQVNQGRFSVSMVIPKDIDYKKGNGKIFLYAIDRDSTREYFGDFDQFLIGDAETQAPGDVSPPKVEMEVRDNVLHARISDESGINISQSGIGHEMMVILNDTLKMVVNAYFSSLSDYTSGSLTYALGNLKAGTHHLKLIVWDTYNNKAEQSLTFNIQKPEIRIEELKNYPNPFRDFTTFSFKHNRSDDDLEINLQIVNNIGQVVFRQQYYCYVCEKEKQIGVDFNTSPIRDGHLIYKIDVRSMTENISAFASGKLLFWK